MQKGSFTPIHSNPEIARYRENLYKNFANLFLRSQPENKCFVNLNCHCLGLQKIYASCWGKSVVTVQSRPVDAFI